MPLIASRFDGIPRAYLDWICVLKNRRHQGAAQQLMEALRQTQHNWGIRSLVGITASNEETQCFYQAVPNAMLRDTTIWNDIP